MLNKNIKVETFETKGRPITCKICKHKFTKTDLQKKYLRKGVLPSLSLAFRKPGVSLLVGNHKLRTVRREDVPNKLKS